MEWQQLIGFYHVAKSGSIANAAEITFRTPSALSQQISALEKELGCVLFERVGKRKMLITPLGRKLLQFTIKVFDERKQLDNEIREVGKLCTGRLKIAASFGFQYYCLPEVIRGYMGNFPHVELTFLERSGAECIDLARTGEVDLAIAIDEMVPKDLVTLKIRKVHTLIIAPLGHPLTKKVPITLRDIAEYPLILPPAKLVQRRPHIEQLLEASGISFRKVAEASHFSLASQYVELGLGICVCMKGLVPATFYEKRFEVFTLDHIMGADYGVIVLRKDKILEPYQIAFISEVLDKLADRTCLRATQKELANRGILMPYPQLP